MKRQQTVYIMCGLIASGKSTWARKKAKEELTTIIICKDNLREMIKAEYVFDYTYEDLIESIDCFTFRKALQKGFNVIVDETNITRSKRAFWVNKVNEYNALFDDGVKIELVYFTSKEGNVARRMGNHRGYTEERWQFVYDGMLKTFEEPSIDELPKGSTLTTVTI
jgi:predicted kinase